MLRKVIKITALDSPNVKHALAEMAAGLSPTDKVVVPGVLTWGRYKAYSNVGPGRIWDNEMQAIKLRAEFPEGSAELLFPEESLKLSWQRWAELEKGWTKRGVFAALGCDPGEGSANTVWAGVDRRGLWREPDGRPSLIAQKTPDTSQIPGRTADLGRRWNIPAERWTLDLGGGKEHGDRLRNMGFKVKLIGFGSKASVPLKRGLTQIEVKQEVREDKQAYLNQRAEMYWDLASLMKPRYTEDGKLLPDCGFALPPEGYDEATDRLIKQLRPIPKIYGEGQQESVAKLPPKEEMIAELYNGEFSPDEADALVLAVHGLTHRSSRSQAGGS